MPADFAWIRPEPWGIHVVPADCWIDPSREVGHALVTHGHADHARGGHGRTVATPATLATGILNVQLEYIFPGSFYPLHFYGSWVFIAAVVVTRTMRHLLFGISPADGWTYGAVAGLRRVRNPIGLASNDRLVAAYARALEGVTRSLKRRRFSPE